MVQGIIRDHCLNFIRKKCLPLRVKRQTLSLTPGLLLSETWENKDKFLQLQWTILALSIKGLSRLKIF